MSIIMQMLQKPTLWGVECCFEKASESRCLDYSWKYLRKYLPVHVVAAPPSTHQHKEQSYTLSWTLQKLLLSWCSWKSSVPHNQEESWPLALTCLCVRRRRGHSPPMSAAMVPMLGSRLTTRPTNTATADAPAPTPSSYLLHPTMALKCTGETDVGTRMSSLAQPP